MDKQFLISIVTYDEDDDSVPRINEDGMQALGFKLQHAPSENERCWVMEIGVSFPVIIKYSSRGIFIRDILKTLYAQGHRDGTADVREPILRALKLG